MNNKLSWKCFVKLLYYHRNFHKTRDYSDDRVGIRNLNIFWGNEWVPVVAQRITQKLYNKKKARNFCRWRKKLEIMRRGLFSLRTIMHEMNFFLPTFRWLKRQLTITGPFFLTRIYIWYYTYVFRVVKKFWPLYILLYIAILSICANTFLQRK